MTTYRVTWVDTSTGDAHGVSVRTITTAHTMAQSLQRAKDTKDIVVSIYRPNVFSEHYITYAK